MLKVSWGSQTSRTGFPMTQPQMALTPAALSLAPGTMLAPTLGAPGGVQPMQYIAAPMLQQAAVMAPPGGPHAAPHAAMQPMMAVPTMQPGGLAYTNVAAAPGMPIQYMQYMPMQ